jgi:hypothetical protein
VTPSDLSAADVAAALNRALPESEPGDGVIVQATEYTVSTLPLDHPERHNFEITVAWRNVDRWAVIQRGRQCLGADGEWDWESIPSEREDEWKATHRFDLDTALRLAREAAPKVKVNGRTFAEWEAHWARMGAGQ